MLLKNKRQCRTCLFAWGNPNQSPFCDYQIITGRRRRNTETFCQCYLSRPQGKKKLSEEQKRAYYHKDMKGNEKNAR